MSSKLEQAVEKSIQAETRRGAKAIEGLSESQKEAFKKAYNRESRHSPEIWAVLPEFESLASI